MPRGVASVHALPSSHHEGPWDHIVTPPGTKERLLGTAALTMRHGRRLAALPGPPSGLILLAGPPGTGKTTLAHGLAQAAALAVADRGATTFIEIDPHAMPSEMLGESQRNVVRLLRDVVPELARGRPHVIVLIDEVDSFAVRRDLASFETNPVDVQRATDAVLTGMDHLAATLPGTLFVTATNFLRAVDEAFLSRADLIVELGLPDARPGRRSSRRPWPTWPGLARPQGPGRGQCSARRAGRADRRMGRPPRAEAAARVIGADPALANDPANLTAAHLRAASGSPPALERCSRSR